MDKHALILDFPELTEKIHELKVSNNHFRKLFDEYHDLTHEVHSIETGASVTSDLYLTELRKKRIHLKDELYKLLTH